MRLSFMPAFAALVVLASVSTPASAQSEDHGIRFAQRGLGQSFPATVSLSADPNWLLYGFQRDGISYLQVNDLAGRVELIIGNADGTFFPLPAGDRVVRTSLPGQRVPVPANAVRTEIYRADEFALVLYKSATETLWSIELR